MNLYCVQHAEALPREVDPERPLSAKGRADIEAVASFLAARRICRPRRILHSGKARARETAEALAAKLGPECGVARAEGLEPLADPSMWAERCREEGDDLMLVGHLPHMMKLTAALLGAAEKEKIIGFRRGSVVCLGRDGEGGWTVRWMITPECAGG